MSDVIFDTDGDVTFEDQIVSSTIDGGTPAGGETSLGGEMGDLFLIASRQLQDETGVAWPPSVLVKYADLALLEIIKLRPTAHPEEKLIQLVAGAKQIFPDGTIEFLEAVCNMGTSGTVVGGTITPIKKTAMDNLLPSWMSYPSAAEVLHLVTDDKNPDNFFVFPPQGATPVQILVVMSTPADEVTSDTTAFPLDPTYKPAFVKYLVFMALSEETTIPNALNKANGYYSKFLMDLGLKGEVEKSLEG
jgi:hypothetical protein